MSAAVMYRHALRAADDHAADCVACVPPSVDRPWAGCRTGRHLDQTYLVAWRARIDALTGDRR